MQFELNFILSITAITVIEQFVCAVCVCVEVLLSHDSPRAKWRPKLQLLLLLLLPTRRQTRLLASLCLTSPLPPPLPSPVSTFHTLPGIIHHSSAATFTPKENASQLGSLSPSLPHCLTLYPFYPCRFSLKYLIAAALIEHFSLSLTLSNPLLT